VWGFSTEHNQAVRSFDDSACLICPIGHIGWAQVNTAKAILSCWGRTRHLPDPRPDLDEFQDQMEAIHTFLSNPDAVRKLETKHATPQNSHSATPSQPRIGKQLIEFTDGHVQLEWDHGRWIVHNWKTIETFPLGRAWIQPEENLLSALIRPPSRPEGVAPAYLVEANLALKKKQDNHGSQHRTHQNNHMQKQATTRQEWPHPNTATMVEYLHKMKWRTPFLRRLRSLSRQWKMAIDSLDCTIFFDFSSCCQSGSGIQPRKSFRLGLIRDGRLICHNRKAYERLKWDDALLSGDHTPDRGISLHFGRTGVFQWNYPNLSTMTQTTEWPQKVSGHTLQNCDIGGLTHTRVDPQPHMPYVIFRHMGPHFDSYANSGIPRH